MWIQLFTAETYPEPCQTSKRVELFAKIIKGWKPLNIFTERSILDVWQGSEYTIAQIINRIVLNFLNYS